MTDHLCGRRGAQGLPVLFHCGAVGTVPEDRLLYRTDWPFYHQALTLARVLIATEGSPELRRAVLHDNAAQLLSTERLGHDPLG